MKRISYGKLKLVAVRRKKQNNALVDSRSQRLWRLLGLARPYWWKLAVTMILTTVTSSLTLVYPALAGRIIDGIAGDRDPIALRNILLLLVGVALFHAIMGFWQFFWLNSIEERVIINLRIQLYSHLQKLPLSFFQQNRTGELLSRLTNDVTLVRDAATNQLTTFVQNLITLVVGLLIIVVGPDALISQVSQFNVKLPTSSDTTSPGQVALWLLLMVPLFMLPYVLSSPFLRKIYKKELAFLSEATTASEEALSNAKVVKAFTREEYEIQRYKQLAWQQFAMSRRRVRGLSLANATSTFLGLAGMAGFLWLAGNAVLTGSLSLGTLTMTIVYIFFLSRPVTTASSIYNQFQMSLGAAERIFDLLDQPVTMVESVYALPLPPVQGAIRFEDVEFGYEPEKPVLHGVSFAVEPGQVLALVGPSGAGKTTIANLIPRFFDVDRGRISVDGYDISQVQIKSLRDQIGIVLQEPVLFGTTIRENIAYGSLDATQEQIEQAARAANAHSFIAELPDGYDTLVGERGVKLSVGQRQRVAIARALLRNPRILILDEATSSLDNESEYLVQQALERLMRDRTTIVIAHRLTTIQNADHIVVVERGRVVEEGKHDELLDRQGAYYRLYTRTFLDPAENLIE